MRSSSSTSAARPPGAPVQQRPDDRSTHAHRQLIGAVGLALPVVLVVVAGTRAVEGTPRWQPLDSISAYYYSGATAVFVGLLVALALFLFTYRGYRNAYGWADRAAAITAGVAALGVALYPTSAPAGMQDPEWWRPATGAIHYLAAVVLFAMFAVFSLWLFRLGAPGEPPTIGKRRRNGVYLACGVVILVSLAWAGVAGLLGASIFLPESVALAAFAVSWLVKGHAIRSLRAAARSLAANVGGDGGGHEAHRRRG